MRNTLIQTLPPHTELIVTINPPMTADERPYVLSHKGKTSAVVRVVDSSQVSITNPSEELAVFVFSVGAVMRIAPEIHAAISAFLHARKNPE